MIRRQKDTHPPKQGRPTEGNDENLKSERRKDKKIERRKDKKTPTCQSNQRGETNSQKDNMTEI